MVSNTFSSSSRIGFIDVLHHDKSVQTIHIPQLEEHLNYILAEFDRAYGETHSIGTAEHMRERWEFAEFVAADLADLSNGSSPTPLPYIELL